MKIERIDDKTVKCFISNEELEEFEITYKDFITRSEKAKEVVEEIIEQAIEEGGYKPPQFAMDMQIMMMPDKGMVLTLSEKTPEDLQKNPALMEYLKEMRKTLEASKEQELAAQFKAENGSLICSELLGIAPKPQEPTPEARTEAYYHKRPCAEMVGNAVRIFLTTLNNGTLH